MLILYNIEFEFIDMEYRVMAFREKIAWLTLVSMAAAYTLYFGLVLAGHPAGRAMAPMLWLFGSIALAQVIVVVAGTTLFAIRTPKEARARADERDRSIDGRSTRIAYYILMTGMIVVGVVMPFADSGVRLVNAALFALVLAETVRHLVILLSYRGGWHD